MLLGVLVLNSFIGNVFANSIYYRTTNSDSIFIDGNVYLDNNLNSKFDLLDSGIGEVVIELYEDINHNNEIDHNDLKIKTATSNTNGEYNLAIEKQTLIQTTYKVNSSSDDAVQNEPGGVMVLDGFAASGIREIGIRFTDIELPQAARIESATLKITMANGSEDFIEIIAKGEASDNANTFINEDYNIYTRPRTNTVIEWQSSVEREMFQEIEIDGIAEIIQEIVDRPGWRYGNSLALIIADFDCDMFMFDAGYPPELIINYVDETPENTSYILAPKTQNLNSSYELFSEPFVFAKSAIGGHNHYTVDFGFNLKKSDFDEPIIEDIVTPEIHIWPNPTFGPINISTLGITDFDDFEIKVFGVNGRLFNYDKLVFSDEGEGDYDLSHLSKGIYIVVISKESKTLFSEKVIIQ